MSFVNVCYFVNIRLIMDFDQVESKKYDFVLVACIIASVVQLRFVSKNKLELLYCSQCTESS